MNHIATGYNGHFDRLGRPIRHRATQDWTIGQSVNVGFLKGLTVTAFNGQFYNLRSSKGAEYRFTPHFGIERVS